MESIEGRKTSLVQWLHNDCGLSSYTLQLLPGDASTRRYFRISNLGDTSLLLNDPAASYIVMDAPPPNDTNRAFVAIAKGLHDIGIHTPKIVQAELARGFFLLSDFGDLTLLKSLNTANADQFYQKALRTLARLQQCQSVPDYRVPPFTTAFMWDEWAWHKEWFLGKLLRLSLKSVESTLDACYAYLMMQISTQPKVFMHRDYHSNNLMLLQNEEIGVLDFQDAFIGPVTYDLASLLRDCYIAWPETYVRTWVLDFWEMLTLSERLHVKQDTFLHWFDHMGIQRHLKALMTFSRKHVRDGHSQYLSHIPRTLNYLLSVSDKYPSLKSLHLFYLTKVLPAFADIEKSLCVQ